MLELPHQHRTEAGDGEGIHLSQILGMTERRKTELPHDDESREEKQFESPLNSK